MNIFLAVSLLQKYEPLDCDLVAMSRPQQPRAVALLLLLPSFKSYCPEIMSLPRGGQVSIESTLTGT